MYADNYLLKTLKYLFENWYREDTGIVACCLKDGEKEVFATSTKNGSNWVHAERNAYNRFKELHGEPSENSIFVITLSPCLKDLKHRDEAACSDLIRELGISRVHFGVLDTLHVSNIEEYKEIGLNVTLTEKPQLAEMCNKLMQMFDTYDARINTELLEIKQELGDSFFNPISEDGQEYGENHSSSFVFAHNENNENIVEENSDEDMARIFFTMLKSNPEMYDRVKKQPHCLKGMLKKLENMFEQLSFESPPRSPRGT